MATNFEELMDRARDNALNRIQGVPVTLTKLADDGTTSTVNLLAQFNEQAGFVDNFRRAVFQVSKAEAGGFSAIRKGDYFTVDADPQALVWKVFEVRDDLSGMLELKCDGVMERL